MDQLASSIRWFRHGRFVSGLRRKLLREVESPIGYAVIGLTVAAAFVLILAATLTNTWEIGIVESVGLLFGTGAAGLLIKALATPWGKWVTRMVERQDYGRQTEGMADIREDLEYLEARLSADGGRILVLIDDLDRCEPDKAVEVLQAIKLLLNFKSFIVMLGIDARVITGAVEKYYKGLLGPAGASGYEYLDKIVQIPFRIPEPTREALSAFLYEQLGQPKQAGEHQASEQDDENVAAVETADETAVETGAVTSGAKTRAVRVQEGLSEGIRLGVPGLVSPTSSAPPSEPPTTEPSRAEISRSIEAFTHREYQALESLIPCLRPNPRHIKRLINVYRLVRSLAHLKNETHLLDNPEATVLVLLLCAQWPYAAQAMIAAIPSPHDGESFPPAPPLGFLYDQISERLIATRREQLDDDEELLIGLLNRAITLTWEELLVIRRYTVNFNPAVEAEALEMAPITN